MEEGQTGQGKLLGMLVENEGETMNARTVDATDRMRGGGKRGEEGICPWTSKTLEEIKGKVSFYP